jgi:hypothetical protein
MSSLVGFLGAHGSLGSRSFGDSSLTAQWRFDLASLEGIKGPTLTLTRDTTATYYDAGGTLQTAATAGPRFDHDPATGTPLGLLIEEARTNIALYSEDLTQTSEWTPVNTSISANAVTAPDGATTADKLIENSSGPGQHSIRHDTANSLAGATSYTCSVFLKAAENTNALFAINGGAFTGLHSIEVNLSAGSISTGTGTPDATGIQDVGNGWYRVWITEATTSEDVTQLIIYNSEDGVWANRNYTGDGSSGIYIWGLDIEAGAFPTSYIPTTTASVTRNADVCSTTTLDWLNANAGTLYAKGRFAHAAAAERTLACIDDGTATDRIRLYMDAAENINFETINSADTNGASDGAAVIAVDTFFKGGGAYADDDVRAAVDGTLSAADTTAGIPVTDAATTLRVGNDSAGTPFNGWISEIKYYNVRKDNSFLTAETT